MKRKAKAILPVIILILISLAAEFVLSNFTWLNYVRGNDEVKDYSVDYTENVEITDFDTNFALAFFEFPVNSLRFTVRANGEDAKPCYANASFYISDENSTSVASLVKKERIYIDSQPREYTVFLHSYGDATYLDVTFTDFRSDFTVSDVTLNPTYKSGFDLLRFAAIFALLAFLLVAKRSGGFGKLRRDMDFGVSGALACIVCVTMSLCIMIIDTATGGGICYDYPLEEGVDKYSPYIQQLDAFLKGQLHLDVTPSQELLELENPYIYSERSGVPYLFDRAFYDGKYYSYFGIAPLIVFYLPFYLVTRFVPTDVFALGIFSVLSAIFIPLAVNEWAKMRRKVMPWISAMAGVTAYFAAMVPLIQRGRATFYYVASLAATAFAAAFIFWILKALNSDKGRARKVFFALGGVSFALAFLSRINSVVPLVPIIPVFVILYAVKRFKDKKISALIGETAALAIPVAAAVIFSLIYNYLRFDSPLQFGTAYQLTVADTSNYEIYAGGIIPTLYHYFLQPFVFSEYFPFIQMNISRLSDYGRTIYADCNFGIFAVPFMLTLLLSPVILKSKKASFGEKLLLSAALASIALTAFADYCLGGVIFRYTADILPVAALLSAFILVALCGEAQSSLGEKAASLIKKGFAALCAVSIIICFAVSIGMNVNLSAIAPEVYYFAEDFFVFWN